MDTLAARFPNHPEARLAKAVFFCKTGDSKKALRELERALRLTPDHVRTRLERGQLLMILNRYDDASLDFRKVVDSDPGNIRALCGLGESSWRSGKVREAIEAYSKAISAGASDPEVFLGRAEALVLAGRREEAIEDCGKALACDPANPDIHTARGVLNMELGRYEDAMLDLTKAIALDGDLVEAILARGELRSRQGDAIGSTADFAAAVRLNPEEPDLIARWIRSVADAGDVTTALRLLDRELTLHPGVSNLLLLRGDLLLEAMLPDEAEASYRNVVELAPNDLEPHLRLAEFYEHDHEWQAALAEYDLALRIDPHDQPTRLMRAALLEKMGRHREAKTEREDASAMRKWRTR